MSDTYEERREKEREESAQRERKWREEKEARKQKEREEAAERERADQAFKNKMIRRGFVGGTLLLGTMFVVSRYRVAEPFEVLVKTGFGVRDGLSVSRTTFHWPHIQKLTIIDRTAKPISFIISNARSIEMNEFNIPLKGIIAPVNPFTDNDQFRAYIENMSNKTEDERASDILNKIAGQVRALTSELPILELNGDRDRIRDVIMGKIKPELKKQLGIDILELNIEELTDKTDENGNPIPNHTYFATKAERANETAVLQMQQELSTADKISKTAVAENEKELRIKTALARADAVIAEKLQKEREIEAQQKLEICEATAKRLTDIARAEAKVATEQRKIILERELEEKRSETEAARLHADVVTKAKLNADAKITEANGDAQSRIISAKGDAESIRLRADAELYKAQQEAEGLKAFAEARAYLVNMLKQEGHDPEFIKYYVGLLDKLPQTIAIEAAKAVQNLKPQVWNWQNGTGGNNGDNLGVASTINQIIAAFLKMTGGDSPLPPFKPGGYSPLPPFKPAADGLLPEVAKTVKRTLKGI